MSGPVDDLTWLRLLRRRRRVLRPWAAVILVPQVVLCATEADAVALLARHPLHERGGLFERETGSLWCAKDPRVDSVKTAIRGAYGGGRRTITRQGIIGGRVPQKRGPVRRRRL